MKYTVSYKKCATLFWTINITPMFLGGCFLHFLYEWKWEWNEDSTMELQRRVTKFTALP